MAHIKTGMGSVQSFGYASVYHYWWARGWIGLAVLLNTHLKALFSLTLPKTRIPHRCDCGICPPPATECTLRSCRGTPAPGSPPHCPCRGIWRGRIKERGKDERRDKLHHSSCYKTNLYPYSTCSLKITPPTYPYPCPQSHYHIPAFPSPVTNFMYPQPHFPTLYLVCMAFNSHNIVSGLSR